MCHRVICHDCGKYTWEGCGLHIAQALAGLSLEQICRCDDDQDSEHSWATITSPKRTIPRYPLPYPASSNSAAGSSYTATIRAPESGIGSGSGSAASCVDPSPSPVAYKLSKISATSAAEAAIRKAQQAAALEELRRRKEQKEEELKNVNQEALSRLLQGLSRAENDAE